MSRFWGVNKREYPAQKTLEFGLRSTETQPLKRWEGWLMTTATAWLPEEYSAGDFSDDHPFSYQPRLTGSTSVNRREPVIPCDASLSKTSVLFYLYYFHKRYAYTTSSLLMSWSHFIFSILLKRRCWIVTSCLSSVFLRPSKFAQKQHISSGNKHENWAHCLKWFT